MIYYKYLNLICKVILFFTIKINIVSAIAMTNSMEDISNEFSNINKLGKIDIK